MKYGWEAFMLSYHRAKLGGHWYCGSGDMFLVVEEKDSRYSICHYCLSLKDIARKHTTYINNSDPGRMRVEQQSEKSIKITSVCPSKTSD